MQRYRIATDRLRKTSFFTQFKPLGSQRYFSTEKYDGANEVSKSEEQVKNIQVELSGFAKAFEKFSLPEPEQTDEIKSFAHLLRSSKFIDLGDPEGKVVTGKIFHVVGNDLYVDFGWKFHCVCQRPVKNGSDYVRGAVVRIRIKDLELSTKFLGAEKDLTILEADCTLNGLVSTPMRNVTTI